MSAPTILVVEDEDNLLQALKYNLEKEGYSVLAAGDGESGLQLATEAKPNLVILDIMLPKLDGLEVCRLLRRESVVPILMLTARAEEIDRVVGLEVGADDYVTKPFSMRELRARVKALLRRSRLAPEAITAPAGQVLRAGDLEVNLVGHTASLGGGALELKPREFDLLALLVDNKGRAFTRDQIIARIWGDDFMGDTRTVDVHIRWLREKIETDPGSPKRIITIRGLGYRFEG
ncbi:MAG: response regulator transcription factor [Chloroflexi bacterium]|nr:response regulator transcription factor [Chloroflexota bacterium]